MPEPEPGKRRTKWALWAALAVIAAGAALYFKSQAAIKTGGGPVINIPVISATVGELRQTIRVTGTVEAQSFVSLLAPRIQGSRSNTNRGGMGGALAAGPAGGPGGGDFNLILLKLVKAGTQVRKDDVVGEFDPTNQLQRLDDYKDALIQSENQVKKMIASLAATKEAHDQSIRSAKAAWDQAVLDMQTIPVRSAIDAENYKLAAEQTEATYKQLQNEDALLVESQRAQIHVQELNRGQTQIELQRADANVKRMTVRSPIDGVAVMASIVRNGEYGQVREGDQVNAGQPFVTIVDPRSMILNATVNQVDAEVLRLGMKAIVHIDAYPDLDLPGTLVGIGAMSTTSTFRSSYVGQIPIVLKIDKMDSRVIPDLSGSADVVLQSQGLTVVLPRAAVFEEAGGAFVFVKGPEGWIKKQVELGARNNTQIAIHSGVQKGEVVALQRPI